MKKNTVKLNEAALRKIVAESVKRLVKEADKADIDKAWQEEIKRGEFGPESLDMLRSDIEDLVSQWRWKADRIINDYIAIGYEKYVEQELSKCRIKNFSEWYKDTYHETLGELIKKVRAHRKAYSMYIPKEMQQENINQKHYTLQQALETRQKNINQKYYTKQQAIEMGYAPAEYQDSSKPFELWHDPGVGGATIRVERGEPTFSKSGFNIC